MPPNLPEYQRAYHKRKRREVIELLGGRCEEYGTIFNLEIDHVNGYNGRTTPNKTRGGNRNLQDAITLIKAGHKEELRILCSDCNKNNYNHHRAWSKKWHKGVSA